MATGNDEIDRLHDSLGLTDSDFFCECGLSACAVRVKLSRDEFAALRVGSRLVLVAAHANGEPSVSGSPSSEEQEARYSP